VTVAAKRSRLGQVYLDWAAYPLLSAEGLEGGGSKVRFEDLRFESVEGLAQHRGPALAGYVVLSPQLQVEEMYMGRSPRKDASGGGAR
jgi:inner membrane protein